MHARSFSRNITSSLSVSLIAALLSGCGSGGSPSGVTGNITYEGKSITTGSLRFEPVGKSDGPGGRATITDGKYAIPLDQGMQAGKYRVAIYAVRETGKSITNPEVMPGDPTGPRSETVQYIPERYNTNTQLEADLKAGENTQDFALIP